MAGVEVKLNSKGVLQVLGSRELRAHLEAEARALAAAAGPGMVGDAVIGANGRARGGVVTATPEAMVNEARHRSLTRAVGQRAR